MKFTVSSEIAEKYSEVRIGIVKGIDIVPKDGQEYAIEQLKRNAEVNLRNSEWRTDILVQHPFIAAWRETYRSFGVNAKRHQPTAESMIRRVLKGETIPTINPVVDIYLAVEVEKFLPIGGYDLDKIAGDITLRFSPGGETFTPIGGGEEFTNPGEVVYADEKKILTRRWNYRDCEFSKITNESSNIILMIEATSDEIPTPALLAATDLLSERLKLFFDGDISHSTLSVSCTNLMIVEGV